MVVPTCLRNESALTGHRLQQKVSGNRPRKSSSILACDGFVRIKLFIDSDCFFTPLVRHVMGSRWITLGTGFADESGQYLWGPASQASLNLQQDSFLFFEGAGYGFQYVVLVGIWKSTINPLRQQKE